jgi:hypothetical protein
VLVVLVRKPWWTERKLWMQRSDEGEEFVYSPLLMRREEELRLFACGGWCGIARRNQGYDAICRMSQRSEKEAMTEVDVESKATSRLLK